MLCMTELLLWCRGGFFQQIKLHYLMQQFVYFSSLVLNADLLRYK